MKPLIIKNRKIGPGNPVYIVAEMSANHGQDFDKAVAIIESAKKAGADAIKLQTYTPDTITIDSDNASFKLPDDLHGGLTLYELYKEAYTPWEWQPKLKEIAECLGLDFFSAPFDTTAVDFLESMNVPVYKVASSELVDLPLIRRIARSKKPIIMSVGMATLGEIERAVQIAFSEGSEQVALLKCTVAYPAKPESMNLKTIPNLLDTFQVPVGLSDHTLGIEAPISAVALGASIIEKHVTLDRTKDGPDAHFSLEMDEFKAMVTAVRRTESMLGSVIYGPVGKENVSRNYRRSLFAVTDIKEGEVLTDKNIRSIRPGDGLDPWLWDDILGRRARCEIKRGTPLTWVLVD